MTLKARTAYPHAYAANIRATQAPSTQSGEAPSTITMSSVAAQATVDVAGSQRCFRIKNEAVDRSFNVARIRAILQNKARGRRASTLTTHEDLVL
jgi:hypothetical protein